MKFHGMLLFTYLDTLTTEEELQMIMTENAWSRHSWNTAVLIHWKMTISSPFFLLTIVQKMERLISIEIILRVCLWMIILKSLDSMRMQISIINNKNLTGLLRLFWVFSQELLVEAVVLPQMKSSSVNQKSFLEFSQNFLIKQQAIKNYSREMLKAWSHHSQQYFFKRSQSSTDFYQQSRRVLKISIWPLMVSS